MLLRQFLYPSTDKFTNVFKGASSSQSNTDTRTVLEGMWKARQICMTLKPLLIFLQIAVFKKKLVFNNKITVYLVRLDG